MEYPKRSGSNPFKNIGEDFGLPYEVVVCFAECQRQWRNKPREVWECAFVEEINGDASAMIAVFGYWPHWGYTQARSLLQPYQRFLDFSHAVREALPK